MFCENNHHHFLYLYIHIHQLIKQSSFSETPGPTMSKVLLYQDQIYRGFTPLLVLRGGCWRPPFTIILDNKIEANSSDRTRRTIFPYVNLHFIIDFNYAGHWSTENSHASCCSLYKQAEPKLHVPVIPTAELLQNNVKCSGFLRTPRHWVTLFSLPDRMDSSPLPPHFATWPASNHLPYEAILCLAGTEMTQSANQC